MADLLLGPDGDLVLNGNDVLLTSGSQSLLQEVSSRLRSLGPDLFRMDDFAANLGDLRGKANTRVTADAGTAQIIYALTADTLVRPDQLMVQAHPISEQEIAWLVFVHTGGSDSEGLVVELDFNRGVIVRGVRE